MKKLSLTLMLAIMMTSSAVFAGSVDYLVNQSAKFLMTFSRNGATDASADLANYNPAATAFFAPGLYLDFSNQFVFKFYETTRDAVTAVGQAKKTFEQDEPTLLLPNLYAVYNMGQVGVGNLAAYLHAGITAGGGGLKWDDGMPSVQMALLAAGGNTSVEVSSVYYGINVGVAYASPDNTVAVSAGIRTLMPKKTLKVDVKSPGNGGGELEYEAMGFAPIIGFAVKPMKELTLAVRYEFETDLDFEYTTSKVSGSAVGLGGLLPVKGEKGHQNLPAMLALGTEYKASQELTLLVSLNIYFLDQTNNPNLSEEYYKKGWEASIGATYQVMPELKVGAGFIYTNIGAKDELYKSDEALIQIMSNAKAPLNSYSIALGATYVVMPGLDLTLSGSWTHYIPESYEFNMAALGGPTIKGEYNQDVYTIGVGVGYKL